MKFRKFMIVGVAAAMLGVTACGGDDESPIPTAKAETSATTTTSAAAGDFESQLTNPDKRPTVAALNDMLEKALDPDIPAEDKVNLVEGAEVDPDLFDQLVQVREDNPNVTYKIMNPVIGKGPKRASVKVEVRLPDNPPTKIDAAIVFDDGRWKLAKSTVCPLLSAGDVESPLCADEGAATTSKTSGKKTTTSKSAN